MMLAQVLGMPLSMLVNVLMGRMLGPQDYGQYYVLTTYATLAFLFVDWGQGAIIPARIATDRAHSGRYLGSALHWSALASVLVTALLTLLFYWRGERGVFLIALALVCAAQALALMVKSSADAVRGFERTDVAAYAQIGTQLLTALLVLPALALNGSLIACLAAIAGASLIVLFPVWRSLRPAGIGRLSSDRHTIKDMLMAGSSFLILNLVLYLQPTIDAYFLNQYASQESIGWHAAARKLIGPLVFPVSALIAALYPTLCRLWTEDQQEYRRTVQGTLRASLIITVPLAVGCAVFARIGVLLYSEDAYGPAVNNLRILAAYVFLLYISMVLGTSLNAAGKQRQWTFVQFLCLVVSLVVDPLLVPWFQLHMNNGSLGAAIAVVISEALMMCAGIWLLPRGMIDRSIIKCAVLALLAGAAMAGSAWLMSGFNIFIAAPIAMLVYCGVLYAIGGIEPEQLDMLRSLIKRKRGN